MLKKFELKDVVFLAVLSAILLLVSGLIMPIVMFTNIYALRQLLSAPIFAMFIVIALQKTPKLGSLTVVGLFTGVILLFMAVVMFLNNVIAAIFVELLVILFFKGKYSDKSIIFAATMYVPCTLPISLIYNMVMKDQTIGDQIGNLSLTVTIIIGCFTLAFLGAILGNKITKELQKAGKL